MLLATKEEREKVFIFSVSRKRPLARLELRVRLPIQTKTTRATFPSFLPGKG